MGTSTNGFIYQDYYWKPLVVIILRVNRGWFASEGGK